MCPKVRIGMLDFLELALQTTVSHHVGAGNRTCVI